MDRYRGSNIFSGHSPDIDSGVSPPRYGFSTFTPKEPGDRP
ncbi:hypothetical protein AHiyo8_61550 [Arthrobacter sp. Hiyo8]|nr:hypothetical protein AHiyo8_61550 [Arthrobacter sp. Hiyo8]